MQSRPQQVAREHHYLSQGYLAQFTNTGTSKGMLCCVDFSTDEFFPAKPAAVARELDFNRIEVDGIALDALETALKPLEGRAVREIREICKTGRLPDMKAFSYIYNLITLFAVRNPALRNAAADADRYMAKVICELMISSEEMYSEQVRKAKKAGLIQDSEAIPFEQMKDFIRRDGYAISIPIQRHINTEFRVFGNILDKVAQRYWSVITVSSSAPDLITCDRPAPSRVGDKKIFFPISPRHALLGDIESSAPCEFEIDARSVAYINARLIRQCMKQIYSKRPTIAVLEDGQLISCDLEQLFRARSRKHCVDAFSLT